MEYFELKPVEKIFKIEKVERHRPHEIAKPLDKVSARLSPKVVKNVGLKRPRVDNDSNQQTFHSD